MRRAIHRNGVAVRPPAPWSRAIAAPLLERRSYASASPASPPPASSATSPSPSSPFAIFSRPQKLLQRDRAAKSTSSSRLTDYVRDEVAAGMVDRLLDIKRKYKEVVDLGSGAGHLVKELGSDTGTEKVLMTDGCESMLRRDESKSYDVEIERLVMDEELLELGDNTRECIMSSCALHWVNDLPGTLVQIKNSLKPDGVFLGAMIGGETLFELRTSLQLAELEREGGISPRVSPMTDSQSMSNLLSRAGFSLPTIDVDEVTVRYPSMFELVDDLRAMGETNAVVNRRGYLHRDTLLAAASIYAALHGDPNDGSIPATFQVIYVIGWKPDPSQPKAAKRGSATHSMKDLGGSSDLKEG